LEGGQQLKEEKVGRGGCGCSYGAYSGFLRSYPKDGPSRLEIRRSKVIRIRRKMNLLSWKNGSRQLDFLSMPTRWHRKNLR